MSFSYWVFKERGPLRRYFRRAHAALAPDGILYLDAYGGYEAFKVLKERTPYRGYTYVWHQPASVRTSRSSGQRPQPPVVGEGPW